MQINETSEYIGIKVEGITHWLWFRRKNTDIQDGVFTGVGGWGAGGAHTEITIDTWLIKAWISSEAAQYE